MNEERRREMALGRLERKAHKRYPWRSSIAANPKGIAKKEAPGGMLRVYYRYSAWDYELNGREVPRTVALEAFDER